MKVSRLVLVAVGVVVAIGALLLIFRGLAGGGLDVQPAAPGTGPAAPSEQADDEASSTARWTSFARPTDAETPQRPLRPLGADLASPFDRAFANDELAKNALRLEGVSEGDPAVALISGRVLRVGDTIAGFEVRTIRRDTVSLAGPGAMSLELALGDSALPEVGEPPPEEPETRVPRRRRRELDRGQKETNR